MIDSSGVLWMIVPEPKPVERLPSTRIRTTVSHGLGLVKAGSASSPSSLGAIVVVAPSVSAAHRPGHPRRRLRRDLSREPTWALELAGGCALAMAAL